MKVEVTEQDIKKGVRQDQNLCPVARAVRRATRRAVVQVKGFGCGGSCCTGEIEIPKDGFSMNPPNKVKEFVMKFDDGKPVKPFTFVLRGYKRGK